MIRDSIVNLAKTVMMKWHPKARNEVGSPGSADTNIIFILAIVPCATIRLISANRSAGNNGRVQIDIRMTYNSVTKRLNPYLLHFYLQ